MTQEAANDFPPIEAAYTDEFGTIDPQVYEVAKELWSPAERFAARFWHDPERTKGLMLKAVANVSRFLENKNHKVENLRSYLRQTFKRLVLADFEKANNRARILDERFADPSFASPVDEEKAINKKILINELRREMDDWMRGVFDYLQLGYNFEDLVPRYGKASNSIRSKFSKKLKRMVEKIGSHIESADENMKRS